jgi:hypothetical protein
MLPSRRAVTVATLDSYFEAALVRGALAASGIRALVANEAQGTFPSDRGGGSSTEFRVRETDRDRAVDELRRMQLPVVESESGA